MPDRELHQAQLLEIRPMARGDFEASAARADLRVGLVGYLPGKSIKSRSVDERRLRSSFNVIAGQSDRCDGAFHRLAVVCKRSFAGNSDRPEFPGGTSQII